MYVRADPIKRAPPQKRERRTFTATGADPEGEVEGVVLINRLDSGGERRGHACLVTAGAPRL